INNKNFIFIILFFSLLWCYFAGIGGLWYQSSDYNWRNAIFRDLITHSWPLYYNTMDAALVYYIGYWLPSAVLAKIFLFISSKASFYIGNNSLLIYSVFGIFLVFLHVIKAVKVNSYLKVCLVILIMILFSGMDIVGFYFVNGHRYVMLFFKRCVWHIEWWTYMFQFSSFTTVLFWVFNQGIFAWLMTLLFYNNKSKVKNFCLIAVLCFFCAPLPFIGLSVFLAAYTIKFLFYGCKRKQIKKYITGIFSVQNCISVFVIMPIICLYFISNRSIESNGIVNLMSRNNISFYNFILQMLEFFIIEAGIYLFLIAKKYKTNLIFYITLISLFCYPFIKVGGDRDFCMRASIPALLILFILIIKFLFDKYNFKKYKLRYIVLCFCLILGAVNPAIEFARGIRDVVKKRTVFVVEDSIKTFEKKESDYKKRHEEKYYNFITVAPKEKMFFKYLARK
ncbi:MAG: hypothetical protein IKN42_01405, partial [Elusimicrobia bacterium]|nr:hypothetical protein [Elusimicrobiota bacterium]